MAEVINMPRLSDTMEEGTVATWLKKVGDTIKEGDILAEIETDKATMEFESFHEGTLLHIGIEEGETAPVDVLLAIIGEKGEDISGLITSGESSSESKTVETQEEMKTISTSEAPSALPEGVIVVTMPRLSDTMTEGTVATWLKKVGDTVSEGDILAEIETDKATMEFESFNEGTLLEIGIKEGESALVDSVLAIIGPKGTDVSGMAESYKSENGKPSEVKEASTEVKVAAESQSEIAKSTPMAAEAVATNNGERIFASPLAKRMAAEKGISLGQVRGTGENGRIVKSDIENYQPGTGQPQAYAIVGEESFEEIKNSQMRKTIAKRLGESKFSAPHYYLNIELDMDHAIAARIAINKDPDVKISFNDMIVKACAMALRKHPQVNSQWTSNAIRIAKHIHIGVAVAVDDGLLVPVLKFADQMTFSQIGVNVKELAGKARNKKITPQEMDGSTFTVSNLGMFGIKEFTSIINAPNSAILSVGTIVEKPVVKNGAIVIGNTMTVTLACDHRTVDGATGAKFLQTLRQYIENPVTMFV
jgi:pyruvate dehydrogenase E2 component (dihydrolipoamide acetyltransferase)